MCDKTDPATTAPHAQAQETRLEWVRPEIQLVSEKEVECGILISFEYTAPGMGGFS